MKLIWNFVNPDNKVKTMQNETTTQRYIFYFLYKVIAFNALKS